MEIRIQPIGIDQAPIVQKIFEASPTYFRKVARSEVLPHFALNEMTEGPPRVKQSASYKKVFCIVQIDGAPVGVVDLHKDHPQPGLCYIGLLLLEERQQSKGFGRKIYSQVENFVSSQLHCSGVVLGVSQDNDVEGFWEKVGFKRNGRSYVYTSEGHDNQVFEMEKPIPKPLR